MKLQKCFDSERTEPMMTDKPMTPTEPPNDELLEKARYSSEREHELIRRMSEMFPPHSAFEARGLARARYNSRLFQQNRPKPTNEQFDEGFDAGITFAASHAADLARRLVEAEKVIDALNDCDNETDLIGVGDNADHYRRKYPKE